MQRVSEEKFSHDGRDYEVRTYRADDGFVIRAAAADNQEFGPRYGVTFETASDAALWPGIDALHAMVGIVKNDIRRGHIAPRRRS